MCSQKCVCVCCLGSLAVAHTRGTALRRTLLFLRRILLLCKPCVGPEFARGTTHSPLCRVESHSAMSAGTPTQPPSLHANPRMRQQQLKQQLRALQTTFQTYTTTPTPTTLANILPSIRHHLSLVALSLSALSQPLLLPVVPTLLDVLDALADLPLSRVQPVVSDVLAVLVWWSKGAGRWVRSVEDKGSAQYAEVAERVREGYTRLGAVAEQWAAAVTLSSASNPAASTLLPALLTSLALSLPYLSPAPRDSSVDLLISSLHSTSTCSALLASPHIIDLLTCLPSALPSDHPTRLVAVTEVVLSLWRRGGATEVRPYDEYRAMMVYMAGAGALLKQETAAIAQLQQLCSAAVQSSASVASQPLIALFAVVGMLHALDPKAVVYKLHRTKQQSGFDRDNNLSAKTVVLPSTSHAASAASPQTADGSAAVSTAAASVHLDAIFSLQSNFQSAVDQHLSSCLSPSSSLTASTMAAPSFAASQCGVLSAACVNGIEWLHYSHDLLSFITTAFLNLIDTRWLITHSASLSSPPSVHSAAAVEWSRSSYFTLLPHFSRAFSRLFQHAPPQLQCVALTRVRERMRSIHCQWQRHNRGSHHTDSLQQSATTAMEEDNAAEEEDEPSDDTRDDDTSIELAPGAPTTPAAQPTTPPPATLPPIDKHTLTELQNTLFLSVCMALATVCKPALLSALPVSVVCDVVDTLGWLEFVRLNFTAYRDVLLAVVNEGMRRAAMDQQGGTSKKLTAPNSSGSEKQPGWLAWLLSWRRHKRDERQLPVTDVQHNGEEANQPSELVHTFIHSYLLPSLLSAQTTTAPSFAAITAPVFPPSTLTPLLLVDDSDLVSLSRHYFVLGLLSEWQDGCTASDALSALLPYSASFLHCRLRGLLKRAHGLFVRSLALVVRHHNLQRTDESTDGHSAFLSVLLPYTRLVLAQYPVQLGLPTLMDSLVLLFHLLPSDHPLLLDASLTVVDRIQQLIERTAASAVSSPPAAGVVMAAGGSDSLQVPHLVTPPAHTALPAGAAAVTALPTLSTGPDGRTVPCSKCTWWRGSEWCVRRYVVCVA